MKRIIRNSIQALVLAVTLLSLLSLTVAPAFADTGVDHGNAVLFAGPAAWAILVLGALIIAAIGVVFVTHPAPATLEASGGPTGSGIRGYVAKLGLFNRNSRLLLLSNLLGLRPPLGGLGYGVWNVAFNLYLLASGYGIEFVGTLLALRMLFHGILVFPAGLICDAIGRRRSFLIGGVASVGMILVLSLIQDPTLLLVVGALSAIPLALEHVAWEPFMMENSGESERAYLFSMNATVGTVAIMTGSALAAIMPAIIGARLGLGAGNLIPLRITVLSVAAMQAISLLPLYLIRVKGGEGLPAGISLSNIQSRDVISRLVLLAGLSGFGLGFVMQFYNVFFVGKFEAGTNSIGLILALGSLAAILGTLIAPVLAERLGKVRMVSFTGLLSAPFMLSIALVPGLFLAGGAFVLANGLRVMGMPILSAFSMESVGKGERASTVGLTHMAFDILNTPSTYIAGAWLAGAYYSRPFAIAAGVLVLWTLLLLKFFSARVPAPQVALGSD